MRYSCLCFKKQRPREKLVNIVPSREMKQANTGSRKKMEHKIKLRTGGILNSFVLKCKNATSFKVKFKTPIKVKYV